MVMNRLTQFYQGKKVLLTGHTGFKGAWMALWLEEMGAQVAGYSLPPETQPCLHETLGARPAVEHLADIRDAGSVFAAVEGFQPDLVFHLAAQALVRRSYSEPVATLETNLLGTVHLLEALRKHGRPVPAVIITTDKCYENRNWDFGYRESDPLGGHDVYSMSKAACELAVSSWRRSFFDTSSHLGPVATARAGNVIGGGDYAQDRIVPDCVRSILHGKTLEVRSPMATRPWQHVLDCLGGYLWLGMLLAQQGKTSKLADAFNFGPPLQSNVPVKRLVEEFSIHWPAAWEDHSNRNAPHESSRLHLSIDKAAAQLGWHPTWGFEAAVAQTALWYRALHVEGVTDMRAFSARQVWQFMNDAAKSHAPWALPA